MTAKPRLVLHIGANKTGSSAIQRFLALNSADLREEGVIVPSGRFEEAPQVSGAHVFEFEEVLQQGDEGRARFETSLQRLGQSSPPVTILLSAENLAANPRAPELFSGLREAFDIQVLIYIRRQDDFLTSSWQQWYSKIQSDFWAWVTANVGQLGNWRTYLENWERAVGRDHITVRVFERRRLAGGDAIKDFYQFLALDRPFEQFLYPSGVINPSFSDTVMDLVKGNDLVFRDANDNDFYHFVQELTGSKYFKDRRKSLITFAQRQAILHRYAASNLWVKEQYFPDAEGTLFTPPAEGDYEYVGQQQLDEEKLSFLATTLYLAYQQGKQ